MTMGEQGNKETRKQEAEGPEIAVRYVAERNPDGRWLPGAPLADMDSRTFMALPVWLQRSVMACEFYEAARSETGLSVAEAARSETGLSVAKADRSETGLSNEREGGNG